VLAALFAMPGQAATTARAAKKGHAATCHRGDTRLTGSARTLHKLGTHVTPTRRGKGVLCLRVKRVAAGRRAQALAALSRKLSGGVRIGPRHHRRAHRAPRWMRSTRARSALRSLARSIDRTATGWTPPSGFPGTAKAKATAARHPARPTARAATDWFPSHTSVDSSSPSTGTSTTTSDTSYQAPSNDPADVSDFGKHEDIHTNGTKGDQHYSTDLRERLRLPACPTVKGAVDGTDDMTITTVSRGPGTVGKGSFATHTTSHEMRLAISANTTPQGVLETFDLALTYQYREQTQQRTHDGRLVEAAPPRFYSLHAAAHGIKVGPDADREVLSKLDLKGISVSGVGAGTHDLGVGALSNMAFQAHYIGDALYTLRADLLGGACMDVAFSSPDLSLSVPLDLYGKPQSSTWNATMDAGQTGHLSAKVIAVHGATLAPGTHATTLYRSPYGAGTGTWTPASGRFASAPVAFTYTAPTAKWSSADHGSEVSIITQASSHLGQALGLLDVTPTPRRYQLVYTHGSAGSFAFGFTHYSTFDANGTYGEQHDLALQATALLTLDDRREHATGAGPLTWQHGTWATHDDSDEQSGQSSSSRCHVITDQAIIATTPGTMTVKSLTLGATGPNGVPTIAALDVVLSGAADTWQSDVTGTCGTFPAQRYTRNRFLTTLQLQRRPGVSVTVRSDPSNPYGPSSTEIVLGTPWSGGPLTTAVTPSAYDDVAPPAALINWVDAFRIEPMP
jgi:hypothetical protein